MTKRALVFVLLTIPIVGCVFTPPYVTFVDACDALESSEMRSSVVHNTVNNSGEIVLSNVSGRETPVMTTVVVQTPHNESGVNAACFEVWEQDGFLNPDDHIADAAVPMRRGETASPRFAAFTLTCNSDVEVVGISAADIGGFSRTESTSEKVAEIYFRRGGYRSNNFKVRCPDLIIRDG